jgi:hypothetical protein
MHMYKDKGIVCLSYRSEFEVMRNCCVPQLRYAIRNPGLSNCRHSWTLKDGGREGIQTPVGSIPIAAPLIGALCRYVIVGLNTLD